MCLTAHIKGFQNSPCFPGGNRGPGRGSDLPKVTQLGGGVGIRVYLPRVQFTAACPSPGRSSGWGSHWPSLRMTWTSTGCHYFSTKSQRGLVLGRKKRFPPFLGKEVHMGSSGMDTLSFGLKARS